jgi:hypothetical protein
MAEVGTYQMVASNGRPVRKATKVTYPDGTVVRFTERMGKRDALAQAERHLKLARN